MFTGFTDDTIRFFLDLKFHNSTEYFHQEHERYLKDVQKPFYDFIEDLGSQMKDIDPLMEIRPYKCLSHIHRDTRFARDKSPYRDHLWLLFRRAAEPRDRSLFYFFEFGPGRLDWGMGFWGENREAMDLFRKRMAAWPAEIASVIDPFAANRRRLYLGGSVHKRMSVPPQIPERLKRWYLAKEMYIGKAEPKYELAFSEELVKEVGKDFNTLAPLYRMFRGFADENAQQQKEESIV
jgi:uncharacterized protein (TIGR02453 family)